MPPSARPSGHIILRYQTIGFASLGVLMWIVEIARLPHYLFGESPDFLWTRVIARTIVVLAAWGIVHFSTRRLLNRLHELEEFLLICSWCRRVGHNGEWLMLEEYFDSKFHTETSHGICPDCAVQQLAKHRGLQCAAVPPEKPVA